jgi:hypothetical protein
MSMVPTINVLMQVRPNNKKFSQGNFADGSRNRTSLGGLSVLFMKLQQLPEDLERLQIFTGLKPYSFSRRDIYFRASSRIPADTGFPRLHRKHAEAAQFNPIIGFKGVFHTVENRIDRLLGFSLTDTRPLDDLIHKIQLDHFTASVFIAFISYLVGKHISLASMKANRQ